METCWSGGFVSERTAEGLQKQFFPDAGLLLFLNSCFCYEPRLGELIHVNADHLGWLWCSVTQRERNLPRLQSMAARAGPAGHFQMESFLVRKNEIHWDSNIFWRTVLWHNLGLEDVSDLGWECLDRLGIAEFSLPVIVHSGWCLTRLWRTPKFMTPSACFARSKLPQHPQAPETLEIVD